MRIGVIGPFPIARRRSHVLASATSNSVRDLTLALAERSNDVSVFTHADLGYQGRGLLVQVGKGTTPKKTTFSSLARKLLAGAFDVVSLQGISPLNALWRIAGRDRILFSPRGLVSRERPFGIRHSIADVFNERISLTTHLVVAQSSVQRSAITADHGVPGSRILVIPNGVNAQFLQEDESDRNEDEGTILFVGKIGYWKGLDFLLDSIDLALRMKVPLRKVTLVGEPTGWANSLKQKYSHLFQHKVVTHVAGQPRELLTEIYRRASIFVLPSRWDAFGNTAMEAMASGTPVVVSDRVGMSDLIKDGREGFIVPFGDTTRMVSKISYLLSHEDARRRMGRLAQETAFRYTWDRTASLYESAFLQMLRL